MTTAYYHAVDLQGKKADKLKALQEVQDQVKSNEKSIQTEIRELSKDDFYSLYGAFFFGNFLWNPLFNGNGAYHLL